MLCCKLFIHINHKRISTALVILYTVTICQSQKLEPKAKEKYETYIQHLETELQRRQTKSLASNVIPMAYYTAQQTLLFSPCQLLASPIPVNQTGKKKHRVQKMDNMFYRT